jgi:endonuclease/exonuclease/phosphatase family protein
MGLKRKLPALLALRPDIAILSEVACPDKLRYQLPALEGLPIVWVGNKPNKGLAVVSFTGSSLALDSTYRPSNQFVAPVHVGGPKSFRLLATWDHNDRAEGLNRRPGPLLRCLEESAEFCSGGDLVVAGDFNNNPRWDKPSGPNNMSVIAGELVRRDLVSLYHHETGCAFGSELHGTYWHYRRSDMPYHIDYLFVPATWLKGLRSFELGDYDTWCGSGLSDHAPLVAEFG